MRCVQRAARLALHRLLRTASRAAFGVAALLAQLVVAGAIFIELSASLQTDAVKTFAPRTLPQDQVHGSTQRLFLNRLGKFVLIPIGLLLFVRSRLVRLEYEELACAHPRSGGRGPSRWCACATATIRASVFSPIVRFETADGGHSCISVRPSDLSASLPDRRGRLGGL